MRPAVRWALPGFGLAVLIAGWWAAHAMLGEDQRFLLPSPGDVLEALMDEGPALYRAALNTMLGATLGFVLAAILAFVSGIILSLSTPIRATLYPLLMMLQMTPVIVIAPMLVVWVGPGIRSVTTITILVCIFPLIVNTTQGLLATDTQALELFRTWRASRWQQLRHLRIPAALPYVFTGLRIAAVLAPIGALVGDYTAGSSAGDGGGLGFQTIIYSSQARYAALFATAFVTCTLGFVFSGLVILASYLTLHRWHDSYASVR